MCLRTTIFGEINSWAANEQPPHAENEQRNFSIALHLKKWVWALVSSVVQYVYIFGEAAQALLGQATAQNAINKIRRPTQ